MVVSHIREADCFIFQCSLKDDRLYFPVGSEDIVGVRDKTSCLIQTQIRRAQKQVSNYSMY